MSQPLRVLYVNQAAVNGGAGKSLLRLLEALDPEQVEPHVAAPAAGALEAAVRALGVPFYPLPSCRMRPVANLLVCGRRLWGFHKYCQAVKALCERLQPDLVHGNTIVPSWAAVRVAQVPVVWHVRDLKSPPVVMRLVRSGAAQVITVSRTAARRVERLTSPGAPVCTIYDGLSENDTRAGRTREEVRRAWGVPLDTPLIGCMAQMVAWKRHDIMLQALPLIHQQLPQARLVFIGGDLFSDNGSYVRRLRRLQKALGLDDQVIWTGHLPNPVEALVALDVVAHPTPNEPLGRVVMEGLALGLPTVAVDSAGPGEVIQAERSGLLVPAPRPELLAEAVLRVLQDPQLAARLRQGALARAQEFQASVVTPPVVELYHEIMARQPGR